MKEGEKVGLKRRNSCKFLNPKDLGRSDYSVDPF